MTINIQAQDNYTSSDSIEPTTTNEGNGMLERSERSIMTEDLDRSDVHFDFSAWESFRRSSKSLNVEGGRRSTSTLLVHFSSTVSDDDNGADKDVGECYDCEEVKTEAAMLASGDFDAIVDEPELKSPPTNSDGTETSTSHSRSSESSHSPSNETSATITSWDLTDEEKYDIQSWRMRLMVGFVFAREYIPMGYEKKEMNEIIDFLSLRDPNEHPDYLDKPGEEITQAAISSIFFPQHHHEQKSVLLKRGPVLVKGEERELMIFSNGGFLLSRVELGTLVNKLLDIDVSGSNGVMMSEELGMEKLTERFCAIDADGTGLLHRCEVRDVFQSMGIALSDTTLDSLMTKFDSDSNGSINMEEFKTMMMSGMANNNGSQAPKSAAAEVFSWGALVRKALGNKAHHCAATRKLDVAFQISDIKIIEKIGECHNDDSDWARMSFALYLNHASEVEEPPLVVTCAKPGHVDPWMETLRTCITSMDKLDHRTHVADEFCSNLGRIHVKEQKQRKKRSSLWEWKGSTVDWGQEDNDDN